MHFEKLVFTVKYTPPLSHSRRYHCIQHVQSNQPVFKCLETIERPLIRSQTDQNVTQTIKQLSDGQTELNRNCAQMSSLCARAFVFAFLTAEEKSHCSNGSLTVYHLLWCLPSYNILQDESIDLSWVFRHVKRYKLQISLHRCCC